MTSVLRVEDHGPVRLLVLDRPAKRNAFDVALADALWRALEDASAAPDVRAIVVTGAGDTFSAGADVTLFLAAAQPDPDVDLRRVATLYVPMRACTKPLIAAVQGPAIGMGVTMLPHFDLVYAADSATFLVPFVRLGLVVEYGGSFTLPRLIGHQRTRELLLRAQPLDAATAERWGLVTRVFPRESLLSQALAIAGEIAAQPAGAIAECRRLVEHGATHTVDQATAEEARALSTRYGSDENVAAVMSFLAARKKG